MPPSSLTPIGAQASNLAPGAYALYSADMPPAAGLSAPVSVAGSDLFRAFIIERHAVNLQKTAGASKPWSTHPIFGAHFQRYRFCNVYRELDTVTRWIADQWRMPYQDDPDLYFAMAVARFVNWPDTLAELCYPVPWEPDRFVEVLEARQARGEKVYTGAYVIHADQHFSGSKAAYLAAKVLTPLWDARATVRRGVNGLLSAAHGALTRFHGVGSFMAGQIVADLKYVEPLLGAADWHTWAAPGPGSQRGLNRVLGRPENARWVESRWLKALQRLHAEVTPHITAAGMPPLHAQDLQNCLCEWSKMCRLILSEGKPRSCYPGRAGDR